MRKEQTTRYQAGPTIGGFWQVIDLTTGFAARMGGLTLNVMSKDQAFEMRALLNEWQAEDIETIR